MRPQRTVEEWDELNASQAEVRQLQKIPGHQVVLVSQHRYGLDARVPQTFMVWSSCTCMRWMAGRWFPSIEEAVAAHKMHEGAKQ